MKNKRVTIDNTDKSKVVRDRPVKSIIKTITWRIIASVTTFGLAMFFFRSDPEAAQKATGIAIAESLIKMVLYFFHERAWAQLRWGRMLVVIRRNRRLSNKYFFNFLGLKNI
jgi:uncharacterized membrane protein